ncbi:Chromosome-partitioning protein Spo0J [Xylophilus ampelinus]|nr:Chromosome-partitioning protein Spo0J [Xylophilus ampelinus]
MASTRKRLEDLTADLRLPVDAPAGTSAGNAAVPTAPALPPAAVAPALETRFPPARAPSVTPRTGPGQMLAFRGQMREVEGELTTLRDRLSRFEGAMPVRKLDPSTIRASRWANRHDMSFSTPAFAGLKNDIEKAGGNVQPILVRPIVAEPGQYELVFGHRRHRACLELGIPVLASIWEGDLNDLELFAAMDRENRERADLSPYEQGQMYHRALEEGLFPAQRRLADYLGVSHTWVRKALMVAQLPEAIVECFRSPLEITHRHADKIHAALEADRRGVLKRAEKLRGQAVSASAVVDRLLDSAPGGRKDDRVTLKTGDMHLGKAVRAKDGAISLELLPAALVSAPRAQILRALQDALQQLAPAAE